MGKDSSPKPQQVTQTTSNLPEYARPYFENLLQRGQAESYRQYQPYEAERIQGFTPGQMAVQQETMGMQTPGQFGVGTGMIGAGGIGSLGFGQQAAGSGQQFFGMATDPNTQQALMSPYQQAVTDIAKKGAIRDAQIAQQQVSLGAARQGTYGGARQELARGERERGLLDRLSGLQAEGSQKAFDDARRTLQFGSEFGLKGLQTGIQGFGQAAQAGQALGQIGTAQQEADIKRLTAQEMVGGQQQALEQRMLDQRYADFLRQRDYPMEQLGYYSNLLRGLPVGLNTTATTYAQPPSVASQLGGLGLAAYGLRGASKEGLAEGGSVRSFAEGGEVDGPYMLQEPKDIAMEYGGNKQKIEQAAKMGLIDPTSAVMAGMFIDRMRNAQQEEMGSQATVAQETFLQMAGLGATPQAAQMAQMVPQMPTEAGVAALPLPEDTFTAAGGGMVAFANGGVPIEEEIEAYRPRGISSLFGMMPQGIGSGNVDYRLGQLGYTRDQIASMDPAMKRYVVANATAPTAPAAPTAAKPTAPTAPVVPGVTPAVEGPGTTRPAAQADDFDSILRQIQGAMPQGQALEGAEKDIKADREARKAEKSQAGYMSLAIAGLNVAAGTSPFALVNLGKGLSEGLKNYADELKGQKKLDREDRKMLADINKARRDEERGNVTAAMASYEKLLDRVNATDRQRIAAEASRYGADATKYAADIRDPMAMFKAMKNAGVSEEEIKRTTELMKKIGVNPVLGG